MSLFSDKNLSRVIIEKTFMQIKFKEINLHLRKCLEK